MPDFDEVARVVWRYDVIETDNSEAFVNSLEEYTNEGWETVHVNTMLNERGDLLFVAIIRLYT